MNTESANKYLTPTTALIVYKSREEHNPDYYIETREIKNIAGKLQLLSPMPMTEAALRDIAKSYMKANVVDLAFGKIIPSHILYASNQPGKTIVIWYRPAMKRALNFSASFKIRKANEVMVPATLYILKNNEMYIFALDDSNRPDLSSKIYNAPFYNVYDSGKICLGSAHVGKKKSATYEGEAERYERGFYLAEQNLNHNTNACKSKNLANVWNTQCAGASSRPFPVKELVPFKLKTVGELFDKLISNEK